MAREAQAPARWLASHQAMAEMNAVHGIVNTHAQTILCAMPQRTAESL